MSADSILAAEPAKTVNEVSDAQQSDDGGSDKKASVAKTTRKHRAVQCGICAAGFLFLLFVTYGWAYLHGWKFSFTNANYTFPPFSSQYVSTSGPLLTDPADNVLPIAWYTFHPLTLTAWLPQFGIGNAQLMSLYLSPLNYFYLLPFDVAQVLISIVKVAVAFIAMLLFIRQIGYTWRGAFISGVSYALCSVMVMWNGWPHSEVTMYAPLLFLLMDKALSKLKVGYFAGVAVIICLMLVTGMPTYAAYILYVVGAYVLFYGIRVYRKTPSRLIGYFVGFGMAVILGAMLSLPYTGSLLGTIGSNGYSDSRAGMATAQLDWSRIKTLLFPYLKTEQVIHANEGTLYTGVLAMVTLPLTVLNLRKKRVGFFAATAVIAVLLIFTPVLNVVFTHLPLINTSLKFRVIVLLNLALSVLVGVNLDDLLTRKSFTGKDRLLVGGLSAVGVAMFGIMLWRVHPLMEQVRAAATKPQDLQPVHQVYVACAVVALFALVVLVRLITAKKAVSIICSLALMGGVCIDMGYFASKYMPWISQSASTIPAPTDTVQYLQNNTQNNEKFVSLGTWSLFPMTNMYYNLRDISGHGFLFTNSDVTEYYKGISGTVFDASPTRPTFAAIDNESLLKYMGVKYVVSGESNSQSMPIAGTPTPTEAILDGETFTQTFTVAEDKLSGVSFPVGTYGKKHDSGTITVTLRDKRNAVKATSTVQLKDLHDNAKAIFSFAAISGSKGQTYQLTVTVNDPSETGVAVYLNSSDAYAGEATQTNAQSPLSGDLVLSYEYSDARIGTDGLVTRELNEFAPQVELMSSVEVKDTDADVLSAMKQSYQPGKLFFSQKTGAPKDASKVASEPLAADEKISNIVEQRNGNMSFTVKANQTRYVLVNEYNDGNWNAYVDGKKVELSKGNYLFRAVEVPAGEHEVELRYEPTSLKTLFMLAGAGAVVLLVLVAVSGPINRRLKTLGFPKGSHIAKD